MSDLGEYQNNIAALPSIGNLRYENIFKVYQNANSQYFYNILTTITFPKVDDSLFNSINVNEKLPWTVISFNAYGTIDLWWLIVLVNNVRNPLQVSQGGIVKILKPQYVSAVISQLSQSLS